MIEGPGSLGRAQARYRPGLSQRAQNEAMGARVRGMLEERRAQRAEPKSFVGYFRSIDMADKTLLAAAGAVTKGAREAMRFYGASAERLGTELKARDMTVVTAADRASEKRILDIITTRSFPRDNVNAEESGKTGTEAQIRWHVDPLDGTSGFAREQKNFAVGACNMDERGELLHAAICRPFQKELLVATKGKGAYAFPLDDKQKIIGKGRLIRVSETDTLTKGMFFWDGVMSEKSRDPCLRFFDIIGTDAKRLGFRAMGSNLAEEAEIALGRGDLKLTTGVGGAYDILVGRLIIEEAGGTCIDERGLPPDADSKAVLYGNKILVARYRDAFTGCFKGYEGFE